MRVIVCIPVKDPGAQLPLLLQSIAIQTLQPAAIILADSSADKVPVAASVASSPVASITRTLEVDPDHFDHGGTRNRMWREVSADVVIFLTQDALPTEAGSFNDIVHALAQDPANGVAFGRQIPWLDMSPFAHHARHFTYPAEAYTWRPGYDPDTSRRLFCSNVFAAWRTQALADIGGLKENVVSWEDTLSAARLLEHGWNVHYAADATVRHSHDYTLREEFRRYFDMGAVHSTETWFAERYERAQREGMRFVASELRFCREHGVALALPRVGLRNAARWIGYQAGKRFRLVPHPLRLAWSQNRAYWSGRT